MSDRNVWRQLQDALIAGENADLASGQALKIIPQVDDQGSVEYGNGTKDCDVKVFLGGDGSYALFDSGAKKFTLSGVTSELGAVTASGAITLTGTLTPSGTGRELRKQTTLNAAQINTNTSYYGGTLLVSKADGACTVQLETPAAGLAGEFIRIVSLSDQAHVVNCATDDKLVVLNNLTADSVSCDQVGEKIGAIVEAECTGTAWVIRPIAGTWTPTDAA